MVRQQLRGPSGIQTDPELEVHSVDDDKLSLKNVLTVFAVNHPTKNDLERTPKTETFTDVSAETKSQFGDNGFDVTDSEDCGDDSKGSKIDLGYHFTWSDDEEPSFLDQQGFGVNVYESIRAISKEASKKIDAVLAVDHVDQLQEEMKKLRIDIKHRNAQYSELKGLVQMKDNQIGTLELERDLYKADTTNLANDLESFLLKLRRVGGIVSSTCNGCDDSVMTNLIINNDDSLLDVQSLHEPESIIEHDDVTSVSPIDRSKTIVDCQGCTDFPNTELHQKCTDTSGTPYTTSGSTFASNASPINALSQISTIPTVVERPRQSPSPSKDTKIETSMRNISVPKVEVVPQQVRRKNVLSFALCRGNVNSKKKKIIHSTPSTPRNITPKNGQDIKISKLNNDSNFNLEHIPRPHGILQGQIQDMGQRLHSSIKTSEDLRRRVAMLHYYYEQHERPFDNQSFGCNVAPAKQQLEVSDSRQSQVRIGQKRNTNILVEIESKIPQQERDIKPLRKMRVVTFNV
jgi:hypothetical protein